MGYEFVCGSVLFVCACIKRHASCQVGHKRAFPNFSFDIKHKAAESVNYRHLLSNCRLRENSEKQAENHNTRTCHNKRFRAADVQCKVETNNVKFPTEDLPHDLLSRSWRLEMSSEKA